MLVEASTRAADSRGGKTDPAPQEVAQACAGRQGCCIVSADSPAWKGAAMVADHSLPRGLHSKDSTPRVHGGHLTRLGHRWSSRRSHWRSGHRAVTCGRRVPRQFLGNKRKRNEGYSLDVGGGRVRDRLGTWRTAGAEVAQPGRVLPYTPLKSLRWVTTGGCQHPALPWRESSAGQGCGRGPRAQRYWQQEWERPLGVHGSARLGAVSQHPTVLLQQQGRRRQ